MGRQVFAVEKGLRLLKENKDNAQDDAIDILFGTGAPLGTSGETDDAKKGSMYYQTDIGEICMYQKIADTSQASDWVKLEVEADTRKQLTGVVNTPQILDSVLADDILASEWEIHIFEEATPANIKVIKVFATHDGTASADATNVDDTAFAKLKLGSNFVNTILVELNGAGAAQVMRLSVEGDAAQALTFTSRRTDIKAP